MAPANTRMALSQASCQNILHGLLKIVCLAVDEIFKSILICSLPTWGPSNKMSHGIFMPAHKKIYTYIPSQSKFLSAFLLLCLRIRKCVAWKIVGDPNDAGFWITDVSEPVLGLTQATAPAVETVAACRTADGRTESDSQTMPPASHTFVACMPKRCTFLDLRQEKAFFCRPCMLLPQLSQKNLGLSTQQILLLYLYAVL